MACASRGKTDHKQVYDSRQAVRKAELHGGHFLVGREAQMDSLASGPHAVVAPYDAKPSGQGWYEVPIGSTCDPQDRRKGKPHPGHALRIPEEGPHLQPTAPTSRAALVMEKTGKENSRRDGLRLRAGLPDPYRSTAAFATGRTKAHPASFHPLTVAISAGNRDQAWRSGLESRDSISLHEVRSRAIG